MRRDRDRARARRAPSRAELQRLKALVAINRAIVGAVDYDEVLRLIVHRTAAFTGADACVLLLAGEDGRATVAASSGLDIEKAQRFSAPLDEEIDGALRALLELGREDTFIGSPLVGREGIRGVLAVYRRARAGRTPRPDEPFLVSALADQGASAIEHARYRRERAAYEGGLREHAAEAERAREAERRLRESLQAVSAAGTAISGAILALPTTGLEAVFHAVAAESRRVTGAEYAALGIGSDPERPFAPFVVVGTPPDLLPKIGRWPRPVGTFGVVAREGVMLRAADIRAHPAFMGFPPGHPEMTSFLGVPIRYGGRIIGNLFLANKQGAREFTDQDAQMVDMLATRVGVSMEIARLYDAEAAGRAWLQAVIDQMPGAVVLLDAGGRIAAQSGWARAMSAADDGRRDPFGNAPSLDLCLPSGERLPPEEHPHVRALARGEPTTNLELVLRQPDGRLVPVLANAVQVRGPRGDVIGVTATFQDISVRKEVERMREEWTSVVAHDLRQPVSTIGLAAQLLQRSDASPSSEQGAKLLGRISSGAERLRTMIGELLDVTLLDARRLRVEPRAVEVAALVREVVERAAEFSCSGQASYASLRSTDCSPESRLESPDRGRSPTTIDRT